MHFVLRDWHAIRYDAKAFDDIRLIASFGQWPLQRVNDPDVPRGGFPK